MATEELMNMKIFNLPAVMSARRSSREGFIITLRVAESIRPLPGQFLHLQIDSATWTPFLRRPFSIWSASRDGDSTIIEVLFKVVGKGTRMMSELNNADMKVLLPLGNSFRIEKDKKSYVMVAGGAGIVPFNLLARHLALASPEARITLLFGARTASQLYGLDELKKLNIEIVTCTEDASEGTRGVVTDLLLKFLEGAPAASMQVFSCGPMGLLKKIAEIASRAGVDSQVSLETHMGCALGACRACVVRVSNGNGWRYSRVCCEGPNYGSDQIIWE